MTPIKVFQRAFPSANTVLITGNHPILVDPGFATDRDELEAWLTAQGVPPQHLALIVNTHYHTDHVGANRYLQDTYGIPIAAHTIEAEVANRHDPDLGKRIWLDQPLEDYHVDVALREGAVLETGEATVQVLHLPGHSQGQIGLYDAEEQVLICGDMVHSNDVAWVNLIGEGENALETSMASIQRVAALPIRWAVSGHGPIMDNPKEAFARALRRYTAWQADPEKIAWHACKRIYAFELMLQEGMAREGIAPYLQGCQWYQDYCRVSFHTDPLDFVDSFIEELLRSRAAGWEGERLIPLTYYRKIKRE